MRMAASAISAMAGTLGARDCTWQQEPAWSPSTANSAFASWRKLPYIVAKVLLILTCGALFRRGPGSRPSELATGF